MDESNFYYEQATRAWGTTYKAPTLEKPKGKIMRRSMFATIAYTEIKGEPKAFIHWTLVIPRKSYKPLPDRIQTQEINTKDKIQLKQRYTADFVNTRTCAALKDELKSLGIRAPENRMASIKFYFKYGDKKSRTKFSGIYFLHYMLLSVILLMNRLIIFAMWI